MAVTARHQSHAPWLIPVALNLQLEQLFTPLIPRLALLMAVQGRGRQLDRSLSRHKFGRVLHAAGKPFSRARCARAVIKALK